MNKEKLEKALEKLKIPKSFYSLNGDLLPDRIVLNKNYDKWEVFYFDERGNRDNLKIFDSEKKACMFIYDSFLS